MRDNAVGVSDSHGARAIRLQLASRVRGSPTQQTRETLEGSPRTRGLSPDELLDSPSGADLGRVEVAF